MKIQPELHEAIMAKIANGLSYQATADWLAQAHDVRVTKQSISKLAKKYRDERHDITHHVVREYAEKNLPKDLDESGRVLERLLSLFWQVSDECVKAPTSANVDKVTRIHVAYHRAFEAKQKALGIDDPRAEFLAGNISDLLARGFARPSDPQPLPSPAPSGDPEP